VKARPDERTLKRSIEFGSAHIRLGRIVAITLNSRWHPQCGLWL
jgi:hypothetical protein